MLTSYSYIIFRKLGITLHYTPGRNLVKYLSNVIFCFWVKKRIHEGQNHLSIDSYIISDWAGVRNKCFNSNELDTNNQTSDISEKGNKLKFQSKHHGSCSTLVAACLWLWKDRSSNLLWISVLLIPQDRNQKDSFSIVKNLYNVK